MGLKKKRREAEHRAKKKASPRTRRKGPGVPDRPSTGPLASVMLDDQTHVSSCFYDSEPGAFVLTQHGWKPTNPLGGMVRMALEIPDPRLILEAMIGLARATGRSSEMSRADFAGWTPPTRPDTFFGNIVHFKTGLARTGDRSLSGRCERVLESDWMPHDQYLLFQEDPEHTGIVGHYFNFDVEKWMFGAIVHRVSFCHVKVTDSPRNSFLSWS